MSTIMAWRNRRQYEEPSGKTNHITSSSSSNKGLYDSEHSRTSDMYAMTNMSEDMHQILSPSFDSFHDANMNILSQDLSRSSDNSAIRSSYSADSIIRRVEEEIAAARKAATSAKARMNDPTITTSPQSSKLSNVKVSRDPSPVTSRPSKDSSPSHGNTQMEYNSGKYIPTSPRRTLSPSQQTPKQAVSPRQQASPRQSPRYSNYSSPQQNRMMLSINRSSTLSPPQLTKSPRNSATKVNTSRSPRFVNKSKSHESEWTQKDDSYTKDLSECHSSDDDMNDILGVHDDDDEKKSSIEPVLGSALLATVNRTGIRSKIESPSKDSKYNFFSKVDTLRRQVVSGYSHDTDAYDDGSRPDLDLRDKIYLNSNRVDNSFTTNGSYDQDVGTRSNQNDHIHENRSFDSQPTEFSYGVHSPKSASSQPIIVQGHVSPTDTAIGSGTAADSIYFTDEDWQVNGSHEESTQGSLSRSATPVTIGSHRHQSRLKPIKHGNDDNISNINAEKEHTVILEVQDEHDQDLSPSRLKSVENNDAAESSEELTPKSKVSTSAFNHLHSNLNSEQLNTTDRNNQDDYPILQKSSTEDAIVSARHHPVFQKRISSVDSVSLGVGTNKNEEKNYTLSTVKDSAVVSTASTPIMKDSTANKSSPYYFNTIQRFFTESNGNEETATSSIGPKVETSTETTSPRTSYVSEDVQGMKKETDDKSSMNERYSSYLDQEHYDSTSVVSCERDINSRDASQAEIGKEGLAKLHEDTLNGAPSSEILTNSTSAHLSIVNIPQDTIPTSVASVESGDRNESLLLSVSNEDAGTEWDKASELLYKLKEQRVSFSANFSPSHSKGSEGQASVSASPISLGHDPNLSKSRDAEELYTDYAGNYDLDDTEEQGIPEGNVDELSMNMVNPAQSSPRYFNFMRVKRAKHRGRKSNNMQTSTPNQGDAEFSNIQEDNSNQINSAHVSDTFVESDEHDIAKENSTMEEMIRPHAYSENVALVEQQHEIEIVARYSDSENVNQKHSADGISPSSDGCLQVDRKIDANGTSSISIKQQVSSNIDKRENNLNGNTPVTTTQIDPPIGESHLVARSSPERNVLSSTMEKGNSNRRNSSNIRDTHYGKDQSVITKTYNNTLLPDYDASPQKRTDMKKPEGEDESSKQLRRIRFRNPFPIIKPPTSHRDMNDIISEHITGIPDIPVKWIKPKKELRQLIVAAMGTSLPRRSNACGALKVLTRQPKNQMTLVRTDGFLTAVIFAASQSISKKEQDLAIDARTRAVSILKNVCGPKDNRVLVMKHPGVPESLVQVVEMDKGEGCALAAGALALLAKTPCCRESMVQVEGLVDILARAMSGSLDSIANGATEYSMKSKKSRNNDEGNDSDSDSSTDSAKKDRHESLKSVESIRNQAEERRDEYVLDARTNSCAALLHLSKHCPISHQLCASDVLLDSLLFVANEVAIPLHSKSLEIICNLTRFPSNNHRLSRYDGIIDTLVMSSNSPQQEDRITALRALQNLSADPSSKSLLATSQVLTRITSSAMRKDSIEKEVAVATIYNISTEPSAVAAITNTKNVVATLVHLAHSPDSSSDVRLLACEALSTISLWLQTLAGTGKVPEGVSNIPLPSQKTSSWQRWD